MSDQPSAHWTVISFVIFSIGLLILVPSGLCTSIFGASILFGGEGHGDLSMLVVVAMVGGIPMLIGFFMVRSGLALRRKDKD